MVECFNFRLIAPRRPQATTSSGVQIWWNCLALTQVTFHATVPLLYPHWRYPKSPWGLYASPPPPAALAVVGGGCWVVLVACFLSFFFLVKKCRWIHLTNSRRACGSPDWIWTSTTYKRGRQKSPSGDVLLSCSGGVAATFWRLRGSHEKSSPLFVVHILRKTKYTLCTFSTPPAFTSVLHSGR